MARSEALKAYRALPIPDTTEEHWRFTDLKGFDPDEYGLQAGILPRYEDVTTMLDLDVAGYATVTADGIDISQLPEGVRFEPLPEDYERLYSLVGWKEKFAAHNAALWQNGLLVVVPKGLVLDKPLYVRIAVTGQTFWRLVVVAEEGARASLIEEYASPEPDTVAYSNAVTELFVEPNAKLEYVSLQNLSRRHGTSRRIMLASSATPSSTGSPAASARSAARRGSRTTSTAPAQPRASPARTSPTARSISTTTRSRSTSRRTASRTSPSRARCATTPPPSGAA